MKTKPPRKNKLALSFATCAAAMLLSAQALPAATVVLEDFNDLLNLDGFVTGESTGVNWPAGSAYAATGTPPIYDGGVNLRYTLSGYTNTGYQREMSGSISNNGGTGLNGSNYYKRTFSSTSFTSATTIWVSALVSYSTTGSSTSAFLMFNNLGMRLGVLAGKLTILDSGGNNKASSTNTYSAMQTHLIVFSIGFDPSGNETILGWIDPTSATLNSSNCTINFYGPLLGSTLTGDVEFSLRGTTSTDYVSMDAIRIAYGSGVSVSNVMTGQ